MFASACNGVLTNIAQLLFDDISQIIENLKVISMSVLTIRLPVEQHQRLELKKMIETLSNTAIFITSDTRFYIQAIKN